MTRGRRGWLELLLLALLYFAGAKLSLTFAVMPEVLVMLWIPNSIILAALLHGRGRPYAVLALLMIGGEIAADYPAFSVAEAILFGSVNVLEVGTAYVLLRRWDFDPRFASPADIAKFVLAAPLAAAFVSSMGGAATYTWFRGATTTFPDFASVWWFSDGIGLLILTPLVLSIWPPVPHVGDERVELRWYDGVAIVITIAIFVPFLLSHQRMFHGLPVRAFLLLPPVLYFATRFSMRVTSAVVFAAAAVVLFVTKNGQQPFGDVSLRETVLSAQELLFIMATTSFAIVALLSQHRRTAQELELRVSARTAELSAAMAKLQQLAVTDSLTGLLNRRALYDVLRHELVRSRRYGHSLGVIVFDVDHFKSVNDLHGHAAGDEVLRQVAVIATNVVRATDTVARYGGEEFVVIAPETEALSAVLLAERMRNALRSTEITVPEDAVISVTASFGVAMLQSGDESPDDVLRRADQALYAAKAGGRDRVSAFARASEGSSGIPLAQQ